MPHNNDVIALKIDFKLDERGIVRILDLGAGLGSDMEGFDTKYIRPLLLNSLHEATGAAIAPVLGELPFASVCKEALHIPIVMRDPAKIKGALVDASDLATYPKRFLPFSEYSRIQSYTSYVWGKNNKNTVVTPIALNEIEMYKALWYFLMEHSMRASEKPSVAYWSNDTNPLSVTTKELNAGHGFFIKMADRSMGGAKEVFYANSESELKNILAKLHIEYKSCKDTYKKHLYVIEPAYLTVKQLEGVNYNVTGRAFLTLIFNKSTGTLKVKITAAKWMVPIAPLNTKNLEQPQMLSNIKNSRTMISLTEEELNQLSNGIVESYTEVFKQGFLQDNLINYCKSHPYMKQFESCLRENASYKVFLNVYNNPNNHDEYSKYVTIRSQILSLLQRDKVTLFMHQITYYEKFGDVCYMTEPDLETTLESICQLSLLEGFVRELTYLDDSFKTYYPNIPRLIEKEAIVKQMLDHVIAKYLKKKDPTYDTSNMNRALRQVASVGDVTSMRVLIYTRRADVHACSPTNKSVLDNVLTIKDNDTKERCLLLLSQAGVEIKKNKAEFVFGPQNNVEIAINPPLPQEAIYAIQDKNKIQLLTILVSYVEAQFEAKKAPGWVSLKMIDALWDMGTRGEELADLLKHALGDCDKSEDQLSEARYIALKNTTSLIYHKFWHSGDPSIERYALEGFKPKYISGFNEIDLSFIKPNPLLSNKLTNNKSLLFNKQGQLRKITSDGFFNTASDKPKRTPTVYVTNSKVWNDKSNQSQETRAFGSQGRFWDRWQKMKLDSKGSVDVTEDGELPQARKLTERNGPVW